MHNKTPQAVKIVPGTVVKLPGDRIAQWESVGEVGTRFRTERFRCVDTLGLLLKNGSITQAMHDAGQEFNKNFTYAQLNSVGSVRFDRTPGGQWKDSVTERVAWARKRLGDAMDAVGGISSPGGCAVWHVAGLGRSVKEWSMQEGWNGRTINQYEAKGILVAALGMLALHYGQAR
jgi:hypothetical protein